MPADSYDSRELFCSTSLLAQLAARKALHATIGSSSTASRHAESWLIGCYTNLAASIGQCWPVAVFRRGFWCASFGSASTWCRLRCAWKVDIKRRVLCKRCGMWQKHYALVCRVFWRAMPNMSQLPQISAPF